MIEPLRSELRQVISVYSGTKFGTKSLPDLATRLISELSTCMHRASIGRPSLGQERFALEGGVDGAGELSSEAAECCSFGGTRTSRSPAATNSRSSARTRCRQSSSAHNRSPPRSEAQETRSPLL